MPSKEYLTNIKKYAKQFHVVKRYGFVHFSLPMSHEQSR